MEGFKLPKRTASSFFFVTMLGARSSLLIGS